MKYDTFEKDAFLNIKEQTMATNFTSNAALASRIAALGFLIFMYTVAVPNHLS